MKHVKMYFTYLLVLCSLSLGNGVMAEALVHVCRCDGDAVSGGVSCCASGDSCEIEPAEPEECSCHGHASLREDCPVIVQESLCAECVYLPVWFNSIDVDTSFSPTRVEVEEPVQPLAVVLADALVAERTTSIVTPALLAYSIQPSCIQATVQLRL